MIEIHAEGDGQGLRIGIVQSRFNAAIGDALAAACYQELLALGVVEKDITSVSVPGALEAPIALQKLAQTYRYQALIALGAVVRGETYHFDIVADESARGLMDVQLEFGIPIANAILTTDSETQAMARAKQKGAEAARVAVEMARLLKAVDDFKLNK